MRFRIPFLRALALPSLVCALFLAACHLGDEQKVEATISFNQIFDSLAQYDNVLITLKDEGGNTIDVIFEGKVRVPGDVEKLAAPHWDGGKVTVAIVGYKDGKIVYRTETGFDGATNKKDSVYVFVSPDIGIAYGNGPIPMLEGDSINLPAITITPANLKVKDLSWVSSAPDVVRIGKTGFKALKAGTSQITVSLSTDPAKTLLITVTVVDPAKIPESLALSADTLKLSAGGAPGRLEVQFVPTTSAKDLTWSLLDTSIASVSAEGTVQGKRAGETRLIATSTLKASAADTAVVLVTAPKPPEKVVFAKAQTEIFVGGAAESLLVSVLPPEANQHVDFTVSAPLLLDLKNGRISGLLPGEGLVIAASRENPLLADTLKVKITVKQIIESVTLGKKTLTVYTGGDEPILTASVAPSSSNQTVQWRADQAGIARVGETGKVTGVSPGHTWVHAISVADSAKRDSASVTVKTDAPLLTLGRPDTTVSVGSSVTFLPHVPQQEFGVVVAFRWDVDGVPGWDDSAKTVQGVTVKFDQEKDYALRFYVRDSEGNETITPKKVSAVVGPVVTIVSPVDGAYVTKAALKIVWTINDVVQTTGTDTVLKDGPNVIVRSAKDAAGKVFPTSITVHLDSVPPAKPLVKGPASIASGKPTWTWSPGGGGNGTYRIAVDSQVFAGAGIKDTLYIPEPALSEGAHTLYVQERDAAGNWSLPGKVVTVVDRTGPAKPTVKTSVPSPSNVKKPTWSWVSGGGGSGFFQYKFGSADFTSGASTPATDTLYIPAQNLGDGVHTLFVRERDSLGNWSEPGSAAITLDTTAPGAPKLAASSPTSAAPKWTWTSGGGGSGTYRFKVGGDPTGAPEVTVLEHVLTGAVSKTTYILYVQERDAVGNWSPAANLSVYYDLSKPTVTFTAPQASGTFLTKLATVDLAGTSTSPLPGTGNIKSITYTVDGVAGGLATNMTAEGAWSIKALPLVNNKTVAVKVIATDAANNVGEATLNILMDNTAPGAPAFTAQPPPIVNKDDTRTSLAWSWNQPAGTDSFVVKLNGAEVSRQVGTTYTVNTIPDGTYLLEVSGKDFTGNASGFTPATSVIVDRVAPSTPAVPTVSSPTRDNTPTWEWDSVPGGNGSFEYRLASGSNPTGAGSAISTDSYSPALGLADGIWYLQVRERDAAGNWSNWSISSIVTIKISAPSAPTVNRNGPSTNAPKWTWSSNGGGNGTFRYRWNGNNSYLGEGSSTEYAPNLSEATYNLCVSERDAIGFGSEACMSIVVDKTGPSITEYSIVDGFPTNTSPITFTYKKDGVTESFSCDLSDGQTKSCEKTVYDAAGNPSTVSRNVLWRSNVIFVRAGATGGNGSSWDSPLGSIEGLFQPNATKNKEIWLGAGEYSASDEFWVGTGVKIYGGFPNTGYPNALSQRKPTTSPSIILKSIFTADKAGTGSATGATNVVLDGLEFTKGGNVHIANGSLNVTIKDCYFHDMIGQSSGVIVNGTGVRLENLTMKDNPNLYYAAVQVSFGAGTVEVVGGDFRNNVAEFGSGGFFIQAGTVVMSGNAILFGNVTASTLNQIKIWGGHLNISGCQIDEGIDGIVTSDPEYLSYGSNTKL